MIDILFIDVLLIGSSALLILTKIPDFITTWQGLRYTQDPNIEQNPVARWLFHRFGVSLSFAILAFAYILLVVGSYFLFYLTVDLTIAFVPILSKDIVIWTSAIGYVFVALFTSLIQWQVAMYNRTGHMKQPLRLVYQRMTWFYQH